MNRTIPTLLLLLVAGFLGGCDRTTDRASTSAVQDRIDGDGPRSPVFDRNVFENPGSSTERVQDRPDAGPGGAGAVGGGQPVPEPSTLLLVGSGLAVGAARLRRRKRAAFGVGSGV